MTERDLIATYALQGLLANPGVGQWSPQDLAADAVVYADALVEALAQPSGASEVAPGDAVQAPPSDFEPSAQDGPKARAAHRAQVKANIRAMAQRVTDEHWATFEAYVEEHTLGWQQQSEAVADHADVMTAVEAARDRIEEMLSSQAA